MKTLGVHLMGGLGNQLFQMAALYHICKQTGRTARRSITHSPSPHSSISYFDTIFAAWKDLAVTGGHVVEEPRESYMEWSGLLSACPPSTTLIGYFQDYRYIDPEFVQTLSLPVPRRDMTDKVFIHVRGGDYVGHGVLGLNLDDYYTRAIAKFPNASFAVFTNDVSHLLNRPWLNGLKYELVDENELDSLVLMSACAGGICANSTFSWWAAYLNPNRPILLPSRWFVHSDRDTSGLYFPGVQTCEV
jgi:Glycosyl transferase family 11